MAQKKATETGETVAFSFPEYGVTVQASSLEEANQKLQDLLPAKP